MAAQPMPCSVTYALMYINTCKMAYLRCMMNAISIYCPLYQQNKSHLLHFVGDDNFCDSGLNSLKFPGRFLFYLDDQLLDAQNCVVCAVLILHQACQFQ